jgi:hypothetical protein
LLVALEGATETRRAVLLVVLERAMDTLRAAVPVAELSQSGNLKKMKTVEGKQ